MLTVVESTLRLAAETLAKLPWVRLAVAFGSMARGTPRHDSDTDVGVLLSAGAPADGLTVVELALGRALRCPIDVVDLATAPPLLRFEIAGDGRPLVERDTRAWPAFRAHAMIDWFDWAPTARAMARIGTERLRRQVTRGTS